VITVRLVCGCQMEIEPTSEAPECPTHHERRVQHVNSPAPRFTVYGASGVKGPLVTHAQ
jgi:hypothetical protein